MLTRNTLKAVKALQQKKHRREEGLFVVEGGKSVHEVLLSNFVVEAVYVTHAYEAQLKNLLDARGLAPVQATQAQLVEMGSFESNDAALAVVRMKDNQPLQPEDGEYLLALDDIRDPGNLGTIIRTADWYGISKIVCSPETAEFYNPKVVSASMGSFTRVRLYYTELAGYLEQHPGRTSYGAFLDGKDIHQLRFDTHGGIIVIGNESHGIHPAVAAQIAQRITIPRFGHAESLNAGIATAIILDNWRRSGLANHLCINTLP